MPKVSLFSQDYTEFLDGGIAKGRITGIYGPAGSGKTLSCMLALLSKDLVHKKIIYIDTESGFYVDRLKQLSPESKDVLKRIIFFFPKSFEELMKISLNIERIVSKDTGLIVVDTISSFYRLEIARKHDQRTLNKEFVSITGVFSQLAKKYDIPVVFTSQVYADMKNKGKVIPIGSFILKNRCKFLIELEKLDNNLRRAKVIRDINNELLEESQKEKEMVFMIINEGITKI